MRGRIELDDVQFADNTTHNGQFANGFRIVHAPDGHWFLDFCDHNHSSGQTIIVTRIRVPNGLLPLIGDYITDAIAQTRNDTNIDN